MPDGFPSLQLFYLPTTAAVALFFFSLLLLFSHQFVVKLLFNLAPVYSQGEGKVERISHVHRCNTLLNAACFAPTRTNVPTKTMMKASPEQDFHNSGHPNLMQVNLLCFFLFLQKCFCFFFVPLLKRAQLHHLLFVFPSLSNYNRVQPCCKIHH